MKRTTLYILLAISIAALLLMATAARSHGIQHPHPYAVASWLAAIFAFGAVVVMLAQHIINGRRIYLYFGGVFLTLGIIGVWDALTFPYTTAFRGQGMDWQVLALWQLQWIILAFALLAGLVFSGGRKPRQQDTGGIVSVIVTAVVCASVIIFAFTWLQSLAGLFGNGKIGMISSIVCAFIFAISCFAYSRTYIHRNNGVLLWMSYGLIFATLAQASMAIQIRPSETLFGFAGVMKVLAFLFPLVGMLAEHTRLQVKIKEHSDDLNSLIQAQRAVATMTTPADLFQQIVDLVSSAISPAAVCLMPFDPDRGLLRIAAQTGLDETSAKQLMFRPGEGPIGGSFADKAVSVVRDIDDDPALAQKLVKTGSLRSAIFFPLEVRNECLGVIGIFFNGRNAHKLSKERVRLMEALADQAALAVESFRMRGRMVSSVRTTDDYAREMELVWEIGQAVASKLDLNDLVDTLAEKLKVAVGAATCSVLVYESNSGGVRIMGHQQLTRHHSISDHIDQCDFAAAMVAQKSEPLVANNFPNSCHCKYPELAKEDGGMHHLLSVPMSLRGFSGAISVFRQNTEPFGEQEKRLLMRLAPMVAAGIRNADLYEREKRIADSLQTNMLPTVETDYDGIQVAAVYKAALDESLVGGDFYEIIDFGDGRYGVVMGDVSGKGLDAAVYAVMSRYMVQAYSADDIDPLYVIPKLNAALCRYTPSGKFVTVIYGIVDTNTRTFTYVNAGQELPFVYNSSENTVCTLKTTGPAAGALADGEYEAETISFDAGDMIVFYTDGATEVRNDGKFLGTEGLQEIVTRNINNGFDRLPDSVVEEVSTYCTGHLRDDIAILVVKARTPGTLF